MFYHTPFQTKETQRYVSRYFGTISLASPAFISTSSTILIYYEIKHHLDASYEVTPLFFIHSQVLGKMSQKLIKSFFASERNYENKLISSDSDDEMGTLKKNTVEFYQNLVTQKNNAKEFAKIIPKNGTGAECWKYFGHLFISEKMVLNEHKFCCLCFQTENRILKG